MICPRCRHENPEANRFCGNCGATLQSKPTVERTATSTSDKTSTSTSHTSHYAPEGYDEEAPKLSPEVIAYDKKIPLIAEPGDDRRNNIPKHIMDEVHDFLDDIHKPVSGGSIGEARSDTRQMFEEEGAAARARADAILNVGPTEIRRGSYLDLNDASDARESQRVSGPSFLGIGTSDYEYVYDDQRPSHWRRNFSLIVLLVLGVLAIVQWRSIRDMGLEYAKSGTIKVHIPKHGEQAESDSNTNQPNGVNNGGAAAAPNMSVNPTRNTDAENAKLKAEEEAAKGQQQSPTATSANNSQPSNASNAAPPAVPPADTATTDNTNSADKTATNNSHPDSQPAAHGGNNHPSAMGAPAASGANNAAASTEEDAPPPTRTAAEHAHSKQKTQLPTATSSPSVPGAFEMQQANILGQTPSSVPWLWSALGKGNPDAPVKLADMYLTGHGVEKSCDQGLVILRSAAARGNARASARLGTLYATGICVPQNRVQAYEWMGTAAGRSASLSSWAEQYRQVLWQQMTPEERARLR